MKIVKYLLLLALILHSLYESVLLLGKYMFLL